MYNILIWNVRGLNIIAKQIKVRKIIQLHNIQLFGLLETRVKAPNLGRVYLNLCPQWCIFSNHVSHYNGRVLIAQLPEVFIVDILICTAKLMHCRIRIQSYKKSFLYTFIYAYNDEGGREELWSSLTSIADGCQEPQCVGRDFNSLLNLDERVGGLPVRSHDIFTMRNYTNLCKLEEVKAVGRFFTQTNKQEGERLEYSPNQTGSCLI